MRILNLKLQVELEGAQRRLAKSPKFQGTRAPGQGSKVTRLQESKVAGFHGFEAPNFRVGFQSRNPLLEPLHECLAGNRCRKSCRNLSGRQNKTCGFSLSFALLVFIVSEGFAIDLGSLEMNSWLFPNIIYMVELICIIGTLLFPPCGNQLVD